MMKLIILPKSLSEELINYELSDIHSQELNEILKELKEIDNNVDIAEINLGRGADWILILATLNSIIGVMALGDKLEKGIDGWIKIGKRISKIFNKSDRVYLDDNAAKIIAITHISNKIDIKDIKLIDQHTTILVDFSDWFKQRNSESFEAKPFNIYNYTFEVNNDRTISLSIKSNGEIIEILDTESEMLNHVF